MKDLLAYGANELEEFASKQLEARILLSHVLKLTHEELLLKFNNPVASHLANEFFEAIKRRKKFEPVAYITGNKEFYGLDFFVNRNVLIPRADTELLVSIVIDEYKNHYQGGEIRILELGTGSGAIAVSLAVNIPAAKLVATDISNEALQVAAKNALRHHVKGQIEFIQSNWYGTLSNTHNNKYEFDIIVSNPPYIAPNDRTYMARETLLYEPQIALFAENQGLEGYYQIASKSREFLSTKHHHRSKLFLEIGFNQRKAVTKILYQYQLNNLKCYQDLQQHDRVVVANLYLM